MRDSQSVVRNHGSRSLKDLLQNICGVQVKLIDMHESAARQPRAVKLMFILSTRPGRIPPAWLPIADKLNRACFPELIALNMSPAILLSGINWPIPGITAPIPMLVTASHEWGNLGRNPRTGNYFINE